jgi:splicing factor 3B subunit 5
MNVTQYEHLQQKYVGAGNADTQKLYVLLTREWLQHQHRDTLACYVGLSTLNSYFAVAENKSTARLKHEYIQRMVRPCL